ncbi:hypothetical protein I8748_32130 [Nostoc sp. CENA67]|uniref:Uncharacterized protein n=1 Tax=Amazonocrinis nigriterrae CENA67 TaxID=2794033 RepID=A0A8J7I0K2_9NOST|nr:hypothetical protein [Amazonocrinis nigriterrae]MBH8566748.1 hypothetical protein [Amazonocrinis nigriterrae CENA67]
MNKEWRQELFKTKSEKTELNPLGFPMSQAKGLRILDICHTTWTRWEKLAMSIPEYEFVQMQLDAMADVTGGITPKVPYQIWVIGKIGEIFTELPHGLPKKGMAKEYLNRDKEQYTRSCYEEEQARYAIKALEAATSV